MFNQPGKLQKAVQWLEHNLSFDMDERVHVFEVTIRALGMYDPLFANCTACYDQADNTLHTDACSSSCILLCSEHAPVKTNRAVCRACVRSHNCAQLCKAMSALYMTALLTKKNVFASNCSAVLGSQLHCPHIKDVLILSVRINREYCLSMYQLSFAVRKLL